MATDISNVQLEIVTNCSTPLNEEQIEILKNPDKADISKDKDISDYELKRGMAIQKAIEKQK